MIRIIVSEIITVFEVIKTTKIDKESKSMKWKKMTRDIQFDQFLLIYF